VFPFQFMVAMLCGWSQREQEDVIAFLREEIRVLKAQLAGRRLVEHYHTERNHQGIGNELMERPLVQRTGGPARRRWRAGGVLIYYRSAA